MRFLGFRNADGTEWGLTPESSIEACPQLLNDVDDRPMRLIADFEVVAPTAEEAWEEAKLVWAEVQEIYLEVPYATEG